MDIARDVQAVLEVLKQRSALLRVQGLFDMQHDVTRHLDASVIGK
jgi:hypothetical protein